MRKKRRQNPRIVNVKASRKVRIAKENRRHGRSESLMRNVASEGPEGRATIARTPAPGNAYLPHTEPCKGDPKNHTNSQTTIRKTSTTSSQNAFGIKITRFIFQSPLQGFISWNVTSPGAGAPGYYSGILVKKTHTEKPHARRQASSRGVYNIIAATPHRNLHSNSGKPQFGNCGGGERAHYHSAVTR